MFEVMVQVISDMKILLEAGILMGGILFRTSKLELLSSHHEGLHLDGQILKISISSIYKELMMWHNLVSMSKEGFRKDFKLNFFSKNNI